MSLDSEPSIIINGIQLSEAQAMSIRVAISHFKDDLEEKGLGDDKLGKELTSGYLERLSEINAIIFVKK